AMLAEYYGSEFPTLTISAATGHNLEVLQRAVFEGLSIVRVYTKAPGKKPDSQAPFVLKMGATVVDVAASVHKDFAAALKFAKIWGGDKYDGQRVTRDYMVQDGDVIELHV
ncbi:MAG: TGS domain-containing protein, partial [Candidatus Entotheonellia bacterium]